MIDFIQQTTTLIQEPTWLSTSPLAFSMVDWFQDGWYELKHYCGHMGKTQWMVVSACTVTFGFLCMRGYSIKG